LIDVALGRGPADAVISGGQVVNVHTGEVLRADVAVVGGRIAAVGMLPQAVRGAETREIDARGLFVAPGLIDGHLHYHHTYLDPAEAAKLLLRNGITGTADGFYGEAIVGGIEAVRAIKEAAEKLPIRLIFLAPTQAYLQNRMFGLIPAKAVSIADLHEMLDWPGCYGLDETPFSSVIDKDDGMLGLFEAAIAKGKVVTGHVRGATEQQVQAFVAMGGTVDHEATSVEDALARARAGMKVLMRFGSGVPDLPNLIGAYTEVGISTRQLALCTDVLLPEAVFEGGVDVAVRRTIEAGVKPVDAIAMGSLNVAEAFRADHDMGSITPGRFADMVLLEDLASFKVRKVIFGGREVVDGKRLLVDSERPIYPGFMTDTVHLAKALGPDDFLVQTNRQDGPVSVRVIGVSATDLVTTESFETLEAVDGIIRPDPDKDVAMTAMVDRLGKKSGMSVAFIKGFTLKSGAIASTHNAVCENLAVVGTSSADMAFAAAELQRIGGGQVVVRDGKVLAAFRMPVLGLFSDQPYEDVLASRRDIQAAAEQLGCTLNDPLLKLEFSYACAEFPLLRMSEEGLFRTDTKQRLSVVVEADDVETAS
jgi:adenine deaminase